MSLLVSGKVDGGSLRNKVRDNIDDMPFRVCIGPRKHKGFKDVQNYMTHQKCDYNIRPLTLKADKNLIVRPPRRLKTKGIYTGEWSLDTMQVHGYGKVTYSAQFNDFYKKGYFINKELQQDPDLPEGSSMGKKWFRDFKQKINYCHMGKYENDEPVDGLIITSNQIFFADPDAE